jgi:serine/threonine protein kinase
LIAGEVLENYKIIRPLGRGGMGDVYLALDLRLARNVALKMISEKTLSDERSLMRFKREAHAAAALNHPNICSLYDVGEWQNRPFIAMEYVEGLTLHEMIRTNPLTITEIVEIAIQIADALDEAHQKNVIHRDIKSSNIMITQRKQVKLLDFGLAKLNSSSSESVGMLESSQTGLVVGTVDYMSPEQILGDVVDHRTDLFSFGVVLYEMITGRLPFSGNTVPQIIAALLHKDPEPITAFRSDVPDLLSQTVRQMLTKNREKRSQSAHNIFVALEQLRSKTTQPIIAFHAMKSKKLFLIAVLIVISGLTLYNFYDKNFISPANQSIRTQEKIDSILPLPCKVFGPNELNYLSDAIPSSLSTLLGSVPGLETNVPPRSADYRFEVGKEDYNQVAEVYGVNTFVITTISTETNRLVLNVQILQAPSRKVLWSNQYVGTIQNYIELTRQAADGIRLLLRPESNPIVIKSTSGFASNSAAELAFRQGKFYATQYGEHHYSTDFDNALSGFKRALELDKKLADAAGEIGILYFLRFQKTSKPSDLNQVDRWGHEALRIEPKCSNGWSARALHEIAQTPTNNKKLLDYALKAASFGRNSSTNQVTLSVALGLSSLTLSMKAGEECLRLDPLFPDANILRMESLIGLGRSAEGILPAKQLLQVNPELKTGLFFESLIYSNLSRLQESQIRINKLKQRKKDEEFYPDLVLIANQAYALQAGDYKEATRLGKLLDEGDEVVGSTADRAKYIAPLMARHGMYDDALKLLKRALELNQLPYDLLILNPDLLKLRKDPGFHEIFIRSKSNFDEAIEILKESKTNGDLPSYLDIPLKEIENRFLTIEKENME